MTTRVCIRDALAAATARLAACSDSARLDAELLLACAIDVPRSYLFAHPEECLDAGAESRFQRALERRLAGAPIAYITGTREFYSVELSVSPATLVPRPETELLVDLALAEIPREAAWRILDLGTGSGAIAIAIAAERPLSRVTAVDISAAAIAVAKQNVGRLALGNVRCLEGDWIAPVAGERFEIAVSNPPYVRADDPALGGLEAEPPEALVAGSDGLDAIRILCRDCGGVLTDSGLLLLEHGADQQEAVAGILAGHGWADIRCRNDLAGRPRVTLARRPSRSP